MSGRGLTASPNASKEKCVSTWVVLGKHGEEGVSGVLSSLGAVGGVRNGCVSSSVCAGVSSCPGVD